MQPARQPQPLQRPLPQNRKPQSLPQWPPRRALPRLRPRVPALHQARRRLRLKKFAARRSFAASPARTTSTSRRFPAPELVAASAKTTFLQPLATAAQQHPQRKLLDKRHLPPLRHMLLLRCVRLHLLHRLHPQLAARRPHCSKQRFLAKSSISAITKCSRCLPCGRKSPSTWCSRSAFRRTCTQSKRLTSPPSPTCVRKRKPNSSRKSAPSSRSCRSSFAPPSTRCARIRRSTLPSMARTSSFTKSATSASPSRLIGD